MFRIGFIHPATFKLDGGAMFGIIPKPLWTKKIEADDKNRILMSLRIMFYQTNNRLVLIDTGIGDYHPDKFNTQFEVKSSKNPIEEGLKKIGKTLDDVTDIIITHLHFDHVGGLGTFENGILKNLFKNATLHLHKKHYEYSLHPTKRDTGSFHSHIFKPLIEDYIIRGKVNFLNNLEGELIHEQDLKINYKISFGHTPYMLHPCDSEFIFMSDLCPTEHHIRLPWVTGYDISPGESTKYKEDFFNYIIENNLKLVYEHDNDTWGGTIKKDDHGDFIKESFFKSSKEPCELIKDI